MVRFGLGWPSPAPIEHRDTVTILTVGFGALVANLAAVVLHAFFAFVFTMIAAL